MLRLWLHGEGLRSVDRLAGVDRKIVRRYVAAAKELGLRREGGGEQLDDLFISQVVEAVRPHRKCSPLAISLLDVRPEARLRRPSLTSTDRPVTSATA